MKCNLKLLLYFIVTNLGPSVLLTLFLEHLLSPIMGRSEEPNIGAPHISKSVPCELLLLGYIILWMTRGEEWDSERMKAAIEAMRNKEMGSFTASSVFNVPQTTLQSVMLNTGRKAQVKQ